MQTMDLGLSFVGVGNVLSSVNGHTVGCCVAARLTPNHAYNSPPGDVFLLVDSAVLGADPSSLEFTVRGVRLTGLVWHHPKDSEYVAVARIGKDVILPPLPYKEASTDTGSVYLPRGRLAVDHPDVKLPQHSGCPFVVNGNVEFLVCTIDGEVHAVPLGRQDKFWCSPSLEGDWSYPGDAGITQASLKSGKWVYRRATNFMSDIVVWGTFCAGLKGAYDYNKSYKTLDEFQGWEGDHWKRSEDVEECAKRQRVAVFGELDKTTAVDEADGVEKSTFVFGTSSSTDPEQPE